LPEERAVASISVRELLEDYVGRYGSKGEAVLIAAVRAALELDEKNPFGRLGDFDYKTLKEALAALGETVKPHPYLRALEREYGLITQTYRSTKQQWWSFADRQTLFTWYEERRGRALEDPSLKVLLAKYRVLRPRAWLKRLEELSRKGRLSPSEQRELEEFAFAYLDKVASVLREMKERGDTFREEIEVLERLVDLAYKVSQML